MASDFEASIHERARMLMEEEKRDHPELTWWYLSYAHKAKGFMGGAIIEAHGFVGACHNARLIFITPAPDVETQGVPIPPREVPEPQYRNRLLTRDELESFWGAMKSIREYEEEQKNAERRSRAEGSTEE
jgi:hypothetical protein